MLDARRSKSSCDGDVSKGSRPAASHEGEHSRLTKPGIAEKFASSLTCFPSTSTAVLPTSEQYLITYKNTTLGLPLFLGSRRCL